MRVIQAVAFGGPGVLEPGEAPDPLAGPEQVVVEVAAVPVLFLDTQIRRGLGQDCFPARPPYVPGAGAAGTVIAAGDGLDPAGSAGRA